MRSILMPPFFSILLFGFQPASVCQPLKVNAENSAAHRWLNKKVLDSRILDDMETLDNWQGYTVGGEEIVDACKIFKVNEATNVAAISLSKEQVHNGHPSFNMFAAVCKFS